MNEEALKYAERLVPHSYIDLARQARRSHEQIIRQIIEHRKLPEQPLEDNLIEHWLNEIAQMDSNNFDGNIGVGEREGPPALIFSPNNVSVPFRSHLFLSRRTSAFVALTRYWTFR